MLREYLAFIMHFKFPHSLFRDPPVDNRLIDTYKHVNTNVYNSAFTAITDSTARRTRL